MTSARTRFEQTQKEIKDAEDKFATLSEEQYQARLRAQQAFADVLVEEKILSQKPWSLCISDNYCYLKCDVDSNDWKALSDFAESNYHCAFPLPGNEKETEPSIRFDDGEITISLKGIKDIPGFIAKYNLNVHLSKDHKILKAKLLKRLHEIDEWEKILA